MLFGGVFVKDVRASLPRATGRQEYALRAATAEAAKGLVERIVVHHVGGGVNRDYTAEEIAAYHAFDRGWPGIGYHFLVHPDGRIEYVGDWLTVRYHCGKLNASSLGVCLAGDFTAAAPPDRQLMRARMLIAGIRRVLGREVPALGHRDLDPAATGYPRPECPGRTWESWRLQVTGEVRG